MPRTGRRPGPHCFLRCARQRLARTGKDLAWLGSRRRRTGRNRNSARGDWSQRLAGRSGRQRRTQRSRARSRRSVAGNFAGRRRSLRHRFVLGSRGRARRVGRGTSLGGVFDGFRFRRCGASRSVGFPRQPALHFYRDGFIDRAGVGLLFGDAQLREHIEDHVRFDLELASQLVNSDFRHTVCPAIQLRHRGCQIKPCSLSGISARAGDSAISIVTDWSCCSSAAATGSAGAASPSPPDSNCW